MRGNHAVRPGPWRYIRYVTGEEELYDHRSDPDERVNLAGDPGTLELRRALAVHIPDDDGDGSERTSMVSRRMVESVAETLSGEPA
jgi:hypothetical protein